MAWAGLAALARDGRVKYVSPDREVAATLQHAIPAVDANVAQAAGFDRRGIGIAVIDSGVSAHPDLTDDGCAQSRVVYRENFVPRAADVVMISMLYAKGYPDIYGHGTHIAGILAGNGRCAGENKEQAIIANAPAPQVQFVGVAPKAHLVDLRVLGWNGKGSDSSVIQAIERAIQLKAQYNIRVINLSLGRQVKESSARDPLCQAVERAWQAGIAVVVAAGNRGRLETVTDRGGNTYRIDGYGTIGSPGNDPFVITVGAMRDMGTATRSDDLMASFSSKGPTGIDRIVKPDLVAPGNRLFAANPLNPVTWNNQLRGAFPSNRTGTTTGQEGAFLELSGTSMATPMVAGTAALLAQKFGASITPDAIKAKLMKSATKSFPSRSTFGAQTIQYDIFTVGAGYLDVMGALHHAEATPAGKPALSPRVIYICGAAGGRDCVRVAHAANSLFGSSASSTATWGDSVLWGDAEILNSLTVLGQGDR